MKGNSKMTKETVKQIRTKAGLTQKELANLIGASVKSVSSWETGTHAVSRVYVEKLRDVARMDDLGHKEITLKPGETLTIKGA